MSFKEIQRINEAEIKQGVPDNASWHAKYKDSSYIFIGGLDYGLTEGDVICVMSQFGEVVDCNIVRDRASGRSKGFAFVAFEDQRSTVLTVDNLNGVKLIGRTLRVDHVLDYRRPKDEEEEDEDWYDERRKLIWDYKSFEDNRPIISPSSTMDQSHSIDNSEAAIAKNLERKIYEKLEKRRRERDANQKEEEALEVLVEQMRAGKLSKKDTKEVLTKLRSREEAERRRQKLDIPLTKHH